MAGRLDSLEGGDEIAALEESTRPSLVFELVEGERRSKVVEEDYGKVGGKPTNPTVCARRRATEGAAGVKGRN
jgi:hypothetical protein